MNKKNILIVANILIVFTIIIFENNIIEKNNFVVEEYGYMTAHFCPNYDCSNELEKIINNSKISKCAFYDLTDYEVLEKIKNKKTEILIDEDNYENIGLEIKKSGLMHNKFCILDEKKVITGSFNPTEKNNNLNNIIIITSETIAKNYLEEFEEIKNGKQKQTRITEIKFNNKTLKNYFCPEDNCQEKVLSELNNAKESIYFMTFTFTDKKIASSLILKHNSGLEIKGIAEKFQNDKYSVYNDLIESEINIIYSNHSGLQHNKVFIIDNTTVITGSYNPTNAANTINDENILIITQEDIVQKYLDFFQEHFI